MLNIIGLILLWILRIIGFILGLIIFLILIILFVPFRYDASGSFDEKVNVQVKFSWLLRIINGKFTMDDNGQNTIVRIFFFKVYPGKPKKEKPEKKKKQKKSKDKKKSDKVELKSEDKEHSLVVKEESIVSDELDNKPLDDDPIEDIKDEVVEEVVIEDKTEDSLKDDELNLESEEKTDVVSSESATKEDSKKAKPKKEKKKKEKKPKKEKKDKEPNKNIEQAKELWAFLQESENKGVLKFITKYVVKIIKWILPRKVYVDMELGLEDPALTGYIAAVTSIVYVATKKHIHIAPNFNEQVVKGDFRVKGRLYLYQLLYYIIRVIIDKRVRRLIKKVRS